MRHQVSFRGKRRSRCETVQGRINYKRHCEPFSHEKNVLNCGTLHIQSQHLFSGGDTPDPHRSARCLNIALLASVFPVLRNDPWFPWQRKSDVGAPGLKSTIALRQAYSVESTLSDDRREMSCLIVRSWFAIRQSNRQTTR